MDLGTARRIDDNGVMASLRIAFLVNRFPVLSETFILNQVTGLLDRGHQVEIISRSAAHPGAVQPAVHERDLGRRTTCLGIPRTRLRRRCKLLALLPFLVVRHPVVVFRIAAIFVRDRSAPIVDALYFLLARPRVRSSFDIVHGQFGSLGAIAMLLRDAGVLQGKVVTSFRGYDVSLHLRKYGPAVYRRLLARGDLFLASCEFHRTRLITELGANENRVVVHRSGIDLPAFDRPAHPDRSSPPVRILTVGRLVEKKGAEYAIRALRSVVCDLPDVVCTIIGDGPLRRDLDALVAELQLEDRVVFLGEQNHCEVVEQLTRSSFLVAASVTAANGDQEGIPNALKEAMASGMAVVSTYHAGIPELVQDGVSGYLVAERDVDALAARIRKLATHPGQRDAMGRAGRREVRANYDSELLNDQLVALYHRLL